MIRRLPSAAVMERITFKPAWNIRIPDAVELALLMIAVGPNSSLFKLDILSIATLNKMFRRYFFNIQIRTCHLFQVQQSNLIIFINSNCYFNCRLRAQNVRLLRTSNKAISCSLVGSSSNEQKQNYTIC